VASEVSYRRQRALLDLGRANWYYDPVEESTDTLELMRVMGLEGVASGSHTSCPHPTPPKISSCVSDPSAKAGIMLILNRKKR
jgi:hypothetical protein